MSSNVAEIAIKAKNLASDAVKKVSTDVKNMATNVGKLATQARSASLASLTSAIKNLPAKAKAAAVKSLTSAVKKLSSSAASAAKSLAKATLKATALAAAAATIAASAAVGGTIGQYASFEKELANVSTLVDTNTVSMKNLQSGILAINPALGSAAELTKGLYQTISAGVSAENSIAFLEASAKAAKAGLTDTFTAVDAGTTIMNAFGMGTEDATKIYDLMFNTVKQGKTTFAELAGSVGKLSPIAAAAGVSVEEMHGAIATLTKGGFATSEASSRMATALGAIVKPSSEASKMADELGLKFNASALAADGLQGFLEDVKSATGGNIEQMAQLFGGMESLSVMLALTGKQSQELSNILGTMEESAGTVDEAFDKQKNTLSALWETFKNTIGQQAIMIGEQLAPAIKDVIERTGEWFEKNRELITDEVTDWIFTIIDYIEELKPAYDSIVQRISSWYAANSKIMKQGLADTLQAVASAVVSIAENIDLALIPLKAIVAAFKAWWTVIQYTISKIKSLIEYIGKIPSKIGLSFTGEGSSELPLSEKIAEMQGKLTDFSANVAQQGATYTIDTSGVTQALSDVSVDTTGVTRALINASQASAPAQVTEQSQQSNYYGGDTKTVSFGDINISLPAGTNTNTGNDWRQIVRNYIIPELQTAGAI